MPSRYGEQRNMKCGGCGLPYDDFRCGWTFAEARREIIAIGTDKKTGKTKYGRRHGVLGYLHELKKLSWKAHVDACEAAP